jgi:protein-L-isoaspartate(D-aspartate) O-methyltransferase
MTAASLSASSSFTTAREHMVSNQLRTNDVTDRTVLAAMSTVPREAYVPVGKQHLAYSDACIEIGQGRFLLDPRSLAKMLQAAEIAPHHRVLDIASGTGYSTAVLCQLASDVVTVEENKDLAQSAASNLARAPKLGKLFGMAGPHKDGAPQHGPFDLIFVNGAISEPPKAWREQLRDGGKLLAIILSGPAGKATLFVRQGDTLNGRNIFDATAPHLPGFEGRKSFAF